MYGRWGERAREVGIRRALERLRRFPSGGLQCGGGVGWDGGMCVDCPAASIRRDEITNIALDFFELFLAPECLY